MKSTRPGDAVTEDNAELVSDVPATHPWWGATSSTNDTPSSITFADMEEAFRLIEERRPLKLVIIYMSPQDYSLLLRALDRRSGSPSRALCGLHRVSIETSNYLAPGSVYLEYGEEGRVAALQELGDLLRNEREQAEPQKTGIFTEPDSTLPPNEGAKPFTDDDFDKLIKDIEGLANE